MLDFKLFISHRVLIYGVKLRGGGGVWGVNVIDGLLKSILFAPITV